MSEGNYVARVVKPEAISRLSKEHGADWTEHLLAADCDTVELSDDLEEAERQAQDLANQHKSTVSLWKPSGATDGWPYDLVKNAVPASELETPAPENPKAK